MKSYDSEEKMADSDAGFTEENEVKQMKETPSVDETTEDPAQADRILNFKRGIVAVSVIGCIVLCFMEMGGDKKISQTFAVAILMAALWMTEYIPLVVTAFLPLILFPMFGILDSGDVAINYANNTIFLFIAGYMVALCLQRWNLHRRFALKIISLCGAHPGQLLFGMMLGTFFLSMFVSNTATTVMMVPNAISVLESLEGTSKAEHSSEIKRFGIASMLGICYAANVGGMSSVIGTGTNLVYQAQLAVIFPDAPEVTFASWIGFGLPIGFACFIVIYAYLKVLYLRNFKGDPAPRDFFRREYDALGPWNYEQIAVVAAFSSLAILWIFRPDLEFSSFTIKGWYNIFPEPHYVEDATIGMTVVVILFLMPARPSKLPGAPPLAEGEKDKYSVTLLDWGTANKIPYDIVFLFGGGFALAKAFVESGLSEFLGGKLAAMNVSLVGQVFLVTFAIVWLTELTSNVATTNIMIPLAASLALGAGVSPYTFMIPATLACSCAFTLPIATPPNMIAFSSGRLPLIEMNKAGVVLNIICTFLILGVTFTIVPAVLNVGVREVPEWAYST